MNKFVGFEGIGYLAATFPVSSAAQTYLKNNHTNPRTGNVDINGKKIAVKLNADGTVGFGASTPTAADALLGIIVAYEMDGFASIQIKGGVEDVKTKVAVDAGLKSLAVNDKGEVVAVDGARQTVVAQKSSTDNLFASILL